MEGPDYFKDFKSATLYIANELGVKESDIDFNDHHGEPSGRLFSSWGASHKYLFEFYARRSYDNSGIEVSIGIADSSPPEENMISFEETVSGFKSFERVAGAALHNYNLKRNPVNFRTIFGRVLPYVFCVPNNEIKPQLEILLSGIPLGKGNQLEVFKFRHVSEYQDYYRSFSYAFKLHSFHGSVLVIFPELGGLDSGGAYTDLSFADELVDSVRRKGGIVIVKDYDVEYEKLEKFLLLSAYSFQDHLNIPLEIDQFGLPSFKKFGASFDSEWAKFRKKFYDRKIRDALGDIRPLVQDALKLTCNKKGIDLSGDVKLNPNTLIDLLIKERSLDGRFKAWASAFTGFSNIGSHSKIEPTDEELDDPVIRKRVVMTILLGVHLIEELETIM